MSAVGVTDPRCAGNPLAAVSAGFEQLSGFTANEVRGSSPLCLCATVGRCRLIVTKPVSKAPMASALETITR